MPHTEKGKGTPVPSPMRYAYHWAVNSILSSLGQEPGARGKGYRELTGRIWPSPLQDLDRREDSLLRPLPFLSMLGSQIWSRVWAQVGLSSATCILMPVLSVRTWATR